MSYYFPNVDPIYLFKRAGTEEDPFLFLIDKGHVIKNFYVLKEIPSHTHSFKITDSSGNELTQVTHDNPSEGEYRVDYSQGIVFFGGNMDGEEITAEYYGKGFVHIPATRVRMVDGSDNPMESLQDALNRVADGVRTLEEVGDLEFKGVFSPTSSYRKWNFVSYGGRTYVAIDDVSGENPNESDKWKLVASGADFVGVYDPNKTYDINEIVADPVKKNIYISKIQNNNRPLDDEDAWELMVTLDDFLESVESVIADLENYKQELEQAEQIREQNDANRNQLLNEALDELESFTQIIQAEDEVRNMNEEQRKSAENIRQSNELGRQTQESIRVNNENQRQAAEEVRNQNVQNLITNAETTINNLTESIENMIEDFNNLRTELLSTKDELDSIKEEMTEGLLQITNLRHMGEYDPDTLYVRNNIVTQDGSSYMALKETIGVDPNSENTDYWLPLALKGRDSSQISIDGVTPDESGIIHLDQLDIVRESVFEEFVDETNLKIGDLSNLRTARKDSLVDAINELKNRIDELIDLIS